MTKDEALKLAHEELKHIKTWCLRSIGIGLVNENVLAKIEEALAQPEQELVGRFAKFSDGLWREVTEYSDGVMLYTTPPQPKELEQEPVAWADHGVVNWIVDKQFKHASYLYEGSPQRKPLTDEQIDRLWSQSLADTEGETGLPLREFARAIEAAHGIKE